MAAPPRLGATLLLLLLLRAPPPGWGNEGGALGLCKCRRLTSPPGGRLQDFADKVKGYQACGGHRVRFELPRLQICGLASAAWVVELRRLWEEKEAGRIDAQQGGGGPAPNPPNTHPPMPSTARPPEPPGPTARPLEPHGPTDGPSEPPGPTARPLEPHGPTDGSSEPPGPTARPSEPPGPTDGPPEPHGPTARPSEPPGPTARPLEPQGPIDGPLEPHGPTDGPLEPHGPTSSPTDEALTTDPIGGPSLAPHQGEEAGDGPPPAQPHHYLTAVPVLLGITLVLVGGLTYMLCRRRRPPQGPGPPHRDPGTGTLYYACERG
ncbi:C-X-C motif chemokine 16 [Pangshura tecta]